ncbi:metal ABC transporter ATP-binding protein [Phytohalomonas tamaricis]|uniref:metal ABC transporter ATP-binding protein n=1 Tax=Phytohalomonas tamaricis TaxID=2081032 RepID=UPI000D0B3016|nr:metal ABC transporter ATP-binding protein [Phytohalomonas tamaricis]
MSRHNERPSDSGPAIVVDKVSVRYASGQWALENVSLTLESSSICALLGINGSGKSTLCKAIMGFLPPASGRVAIFKHAVRHAQRRNIMAYVPQVEEIDWDFPVSVYDVVMMGRQGRMGFLRIPARADRVAVETSLARVGIADLAKRQIGALSGGQKKRVFLARALAQESRIMVLDEPFTGVDATTENAIIDILKQLRDEGMTILVVTHNLSVVPEYCDTVAMINRNLIAFGKTEHVFTPANLAQAFGGVLRQFPLDLLAQEREPVQEHLP